MDLTIKDYVVIAGFLFTISTTLVAAGGMIYALKRVIKDVERLETQAEANKENLSRHSADTELHVNHLYMRSIESRLSKLESAVEDGNKRIEDKIDRLLEKLYQKNG